MAVQTIVLETENLLQFYGRILVERATELKNISNIIVADAYFSKYPFVKILINNGFSFVARLRDDAALYHRAKPEKTGKRGRPKTKGERFDFANLSQFKILNQDNKESIYTTIVKSKALKVQLTREATKIIFNDDN